MDKSFNCPIKLPVMLALIITANVALEANVLAYFHSSTIASDVVINADLLNKAITIELHEQNPKYFIVDRSSFLSGQYVVGVVKVTKKLDPRLIIYFVNGSTALVDENQYGEIEFTYIDMNIVDKILLNGSGSGYLDFFIANLKEIGDGLEPRFETFNATSGKNTGSSSNVLSAYAYINVYHVKLIPVVIISNTHDIDIIYRSSHHWLEKSPEEITRTHDQIGEFYILENVYGCMLNADPDSLLILYLNTQATYSVFSPIDLCHSGCNYTYFIGLNPSDNIVFSDKEQPFDLSNTINFFYAVKLKPNTSYLLLLSQIWYEYLQEGLPLPDNLRSEIKDKLDFYAGYGLRVFDVDIATGSFTEITNILTQNTGIPLLHTKAIINTKTQDKYYVIWTYAYPTPKTYLKHIAEVYGRAFNLTLEDLLSELPLHYEWVLRVLPIEDLIPGSKALASIEETKVYRVKFQEPGAYYLALDVGLTLSNAKVSVFSMEKPYEELLLSSRENTKTKITTYIVASEFSAYFVMVEPYTSPFVYSLSISYVLDIDSYKKLLGNFKNINDTLNSPMKYMVTSRALMEIKTEYSRALEYFNNGDALSTLMITNEIIDRINIETQLAGLTLVVTTLVGIFYGAWIFFKGGEKLADIGFPSTIVLTLVSQGYHLLLVVMALVTYAIPMSIGYICKRKLARWKSLLKLLMIRFRRRTRKNK